MTTPTTNTEIVIGKFLGSLGFFSVLMGITLVYYPILEFFGSPDRLAMLSGYVGLWLEGALFIAIGLLASSLTQSQLIAAIVSYAILFTLYFSTVFTKSLSGSSEDLLAAFTTASHSQNFAVGLITPVDLTYYLAGIVACIFLARVHIENRALE